MSTSILQGYSAPEKTAYITAMASIATADSIASEQEINYLGNLAQAAGLNEQEKQHVLAAAKTTSGEPLKDALAVLKSSELRYSLVADLIAFAEADSTVAEQEKKHISSVASYLKINADQLGALNEYVKEAAAKPAEALDTAAVNSGNAGPAGLPDNLGLGQKLKNAGINIGGLAKGLLSFAGPMIMGNMVSKGLQGSNASAGLSQGNSGSLIGRLTGGKGFSGIGGFLSNLFK